MASRRERAAAKKKAHEASGVPTWSISAKTGSTYTLKRYDGTRTHYNITESQLTDYGIGGQTQSAEQKRIAAVVAKRAEERAAYHAGVAAGTTPSKSSLTTTKKEDPRTAAYLEQEGVSSVEELSRTKEAEPKVTTLEPIAVEQGEPKKTGIAALREEDSIIGNAVRIATDWRTTVALVATVATLGIGAGVSGALATRAAATTLTRTTTGAIVGKVATNPKTIGLTTSLLSKAGMTVGAAAFVATAVGTYPFAKFELAEATDKIGIAIFKANEAGDMEEVERLQAYLEDMVKPSVWDSIISFIPFANVMNRVSDNIKAAQVSAKSIMESTKKKVEAARAKALEPSFAEEREASDIEARERELQEREEDKKYFEGIEEKKQAASDIEREEDKKYYEEIAKKKRETELREREEDTKHFEEREAERLKAKAEERLADETYWKNIIEANAKRKADEREADEAYWAEIKGQALDAADKKVISDWNAGKSALNFKWLGL